MEGEICCLHSKRLRGLVERVMNLLRSQMLLPNIPPSFSLRRSCCSCSLASPPSSPPSSPSPPSPSLFPSSLLDPSLPSLREMMRLFELTSLPIFSSLSQLLTLSQSSPSAQAFVSFAYFTMNNSFPVPEPGWFFFFFFFFFFFLKNGRPCLSLSLLLFCTIHQIQSLFLKDHLAPPSLSSTTRAEPREL